MDLLILEKKTSKNSRLQLNLALNYGSKIEIIEALKKLSKSKKKINEQNLIKNLQTKNITQTYLYCFCTPPRSGKISFDPMLHASAKRLAPQRAKQAESPHLRKMVGRLETNTREAKSTQASTG